MERGNSSTQTEEYLNEPDSSPPLRGTAAPDRVTLPLDWTMAFQPIVDVDARSILGYEALVRGTGDEPAQEVLARVPAGSGLRFDVACVEAAVDLAVALHLSTMLTVNVGAESLANPACAVEFAASALATRPFPAARVMFEVAPRGDALDHAHLKELLAGYQRRGFATAVDKFGAGHRGLDLLADVRPNAVKLSMELIRGVEVEPLRRAIVSGIAQLCQEMNIKVVAVGVETPEQCRALRDVGLHLFQGYLFALPKTGELPAVSPSVWSFTERRLLSHRRTRNRRSADRPDT